MKPLKAFSGLVVAATLVLLAGVSRADIELDFASLTGASVHTVGNGTQYGGGDCQFLPTSTSQNQFRITFSSGVGDSVTDTGYMTGTFHIGTITTLFPGIQTAPVTGIGSVTIHGGGGDLTGTLIWNAIARVGAGDTLNFNGDINLTGIQYDGTQHDLVALKNAGSGTEVITFQFSSRPPYSLEYLCAQQTDSSFSGAISAVPEATTLFAGAGALGLVLVCMGVRKSKK